MSFKFNPFSGDFDVTISASTSGLSASPTFIFSGSETGIQAVSTGTNASGVGVKSSNGTSTAAEFYAAYTIDEAGIVASTNGTTNLAFRTGASGTTRMTVYANGNVGVNSGNLIVQNANGSNTAVLIAASGTTTVPFLYGYRSRNTAASPTAVQANDALLYLQGLGYGATAYSAQGPLITFNASETWTDSAQGNYITFATTPTGTLSQTTRMTISNGGHLGIGASVPAARLDVNGDTAQLTAQFNSNNVSGGYLQWQTSSSTIGYMGAAKVAVSSSLLATDFGVTAAANLYFGSNNGGVTAVKIDTTGVVDVLASTLKVSGPALIPTTIGQVQKTIAFNSATNGTTVAFSKADLAASGYTGTSYGVYSICKVQFYATDGSGSNQGAGVGHIVFYVTGSNVTGAVMLGGAVTLTSIVNTQAPVVSVGVAGNNLVFTFTGGTTIGSAGSIIQVMIVQ